MKSVLKFLCVLGIFTLVVFVSIVVASCTGARFESVYCHVSTFAVGVLSTMVAGQIIDKITDKDERV